MNHQLYGWMSVGYMPKTWTWRSDELHRFDGYCIDQSPSLVQGKGVPVAFCEQKKPDARDTVERNPVPLGRSCSTVIYKVLHIPGGAKFLSSTVYELMRFGCPNKDRTNSSQNIGVSYFRIVFGKHGCVLLFFCWVGSSLQDQCFLLNKFGQTR